MEIFKLMFIFENKLTHRLTVAAKTMQYCHKMGEITKNNHKITTKYTKFPQKDAELPQKDTKFP